MADGNKVALIFLKAQGIIRTQKFTENEREVEEDAINDVPLKHSLGAAFEMEMENI